VIIAKGGMRFMRRRISHQEITYSCKLAKVGMVVVMPFYGFASCESGVEKKRGSAQCEFLGNLFASDVME
jgi:hypothetical protein